MIGICPAIRPWGRRPKRNFYRVTGPGNPKLRRGNTLCGDKVIFLIVARIPAAGGNPALIAIDPLTGAMKQCGAEYTFEQQRRA
jgi:hypothetical protein